MGIAGSRPAIVDGAMGGGGTGFSQGNGPYFPCRKIRLEGFCVPTKWPREEGPFGVCWFILGAERWLAVRTRSPACLGATGSSDLSTGRAGTFLLGARFSCSSSPSPELGPASRVPTAHEGEGRWRGLGFGAASRFPLFLYFPAQLPLPAQMFLQQQLPEQRAVDRLWGRVGTDPG